MVSMRCMHARGGGFYTCEGLMMEGWLILDGLSCERS